MDSPGNAPKLIFKPKDIHQTLLGWLIHAHKGRQRHDLAARHCDSIRIWLGGLAAVFSAIVGTSIFAVFEKEVSKGASSTQLKIVIVVISIISAILTGLVTFLNLSERTEKHRSAGVRYKEVIRDLERIIGRGGSGCDEGDSLVAGIQKRLDELEESAPIVPERIYDRVENEWKKKGMQFVPEAADLYHAKEEGKK